MAGERSLFMQFLNLDYIRIQLAQIAEDMRRKIIRSELLAWGSERQTEILQVTPYKYGPLRSSIRVRMLSDTEIEFSAGGPAAPYALIVHENLSPTVHWTTPGTGPKYIERPVLAGMEAFGKALGI